MTGIVERAKNSLNTYDYAHVYGVDPGYPVQLVRDLVAEVERSSKIVWPDEAAS